MPLTLSSSSPATSSAPALHRVTTIQRVAMVSVHTSPSATLGGQDAGGLNVYVRELGRQLARNGVAVDIFTRRSDPFTDDIVEIADGVRVIYITAGPATALPKDDLFAYLPEFANEMALFSLQSGLRYDVVHTHYWLSGWVGHLLKRYWNAPVVHMYHTLARLKNQVAGGQLLESRVRLDTERRLLSLLDSIVAPNPDERADMVWRMGGRNARICVVPPGIDLDRFQPEESETARDRLGLPARPLVLFVGRVDAMKGIDTLLDGFADLYHREWVGPKPALVFVGGTLLRDGTTVRPGPDLMPVVERAAELGFSEGLLLRGSEPQELLPRYYSACTVAAVPSRYESFGLVAVEAMACGLPVVASRAGGLKFTVEEGVSGLLVEPGSAADLAEALAQVITDRDLRASLQVGARQAAVRFSWQSITPAMLNLYERLAEGERDDLCCMNSVYAS